MKTGDRVNTPKGKGKVWELGTNRHYIKLDSGGTEWFLKNEIKRVKECYSKEFLNICKENIQTKTKRGDVYYKISSIPELKSWFARGGWNVTNEKKLFDDLGIRDWGDLQSKWFNVTFGRLFIESFKERLPLDKIFEDTDPDVNPRWRYDFERKAKLAGYSQSTIDFFLGTLETKYREQSFVGSGPQEEGESARFKKYRTKEIGNFEFLSEMVEKVVKKGKKWAVVHGHPKKGKKDKPKGAVIAYHPTKKKARAQHIAIMLSKKKRGKK